MLYFIQDETANFIKIGFTEGTGLSRLKDLQTGSPAGLVLLCTMPGGRTEERGLHERFAAARVHGEWFRPVPGILRLIGENWPAPPSVAAPEARRVARQPGEPHRIYLAGKISKDDWRAAIVKPGPELGASDRSDLPDSWPTMERAIFGRHSYVGPYFSSAQHCCGHGDDTHGTFADAVYDGQRDDRHGGTLAVAQSNAAAVVSLCLEALRRASVVFAWVDSLDCYGTVTEIGHATALGIPVWIAGPRRFRDMWFVYRQAEVTCWRAASPEESLLYFLGLQSEGRASG